MIGLTDFMIINDYCPSDLLPPLTYRWRLGRIKSKPIFMPHTQILAMPGYLMAESIARADCRFKNQGRLCCLNPQNQNSMMRHIHEFVYIKEPLP